jgi:DNA-binding NarL/FixJ family response regulator
MTLQPESMAETRPRSVLIADDHPMFRLALRYALAARDAKANIVEVASQEALEAAIMADAFDLALLDLAMPGVKGFSSLVYLRCVRPAMPVIVISSYDDPYTVDRARQFGAAAFVPKSAAAEDICHAIEIVLAGGTWLPADKVDVGSADARARRRLTSLTAQQLRVLLCVGEGRLNKQIADELRLAENTVKVHVSTILKKLQCSTRTQAAVLIRSLLLDSSLAPLQIRDEGIS